MRESVPTMIAAPTAIIIHSLHRRIQISEKVFLPIFDSLMVVGALVGAVGSSRALRGDEVANPMCWPGGKFCCVEVELECGVMWREG